MTETLDAALESLRRDQFFRAMADAESASRTFPSHIEIEPDTINHLDVSSFALVEQVRAVAVERCGATGATSGRPLAVRSWTSWR